MEAIKRLNQMRGSSFLTKSFMASIILSKVFLLKVLPQMVLATQLAVNPGGGKVAHRLGRRYPKCKKGYCQPLRPKKLQ